MSRRPTLPSPLMATLLRHCDGTCGICDQFRTPTRRGSRKQIRLRGERWTDRRNLSFRLRRGLVAELPGSADRRRDAVALYRPNLGTRHRRRCIDPGAQTGNERADGDSHAQPMTIATAKDRLLLHCAPLGHEPRPQRRLIAHSVDDSSARRRFARDGVVCHKGANKTGDTGSFLCLNAALRTACSARKLTS